MKRSFLDKLVCPFDHHDLNVRIFEEKDDEIMEGILMCGQCRRYYPVVQGIAIMSPDEYREINFEIPLLERWGERAAVRNGLPTFELSTEKQVGHDDKRW